MIAGIGNRNRPDQKDEQIKYLQHALQLCLSSIDDKDTALYCCKALKNSEPKPVDELNEKDYLILFGIIFLLNLPSFIAIFSGKHP